MGTIGVRLLGYIFLFIYEFVLICVIAFIGFLITGFGTPQGYWISIIISSFVILNIVWSIYITQGYKIKQIACGIFSGVIIAHVLLLGDTHFRNVELSLLGLTPPAQNFNMVLLSSLIGLIQIVFWEMMNKLSIISFKKGDVRQSK